MLVRTVFKGIAAVCALAALSGGAFAQSAIKTVSVSASDRAAASSVTSKFLSAMPQGTQGTQALKIRSDSVTTGSHRGSDNDDYGTQNPADLEYNGGHIISSAVQHPIYQIPSGGPCVAAQPTTCWGDVPTFIKDLGSSEFMHITDQYVKADGNHRYTLGVSFQWSFNVSSTPLVDADMAALAHAAALLAGVSGYGHVFHIFLAPGQVECFDSTFTVCSSNVFCAYHSSAVFSDIGEVVYTVEPNLVGVFGCNQPVNSPNGAFDATYSVLSHETFETITDPDGTAWWNNTNSGLLGSEIGDECLFWLFDANGNFISANPVVQNFNGRRYAIQTEYNNAAHACTIEPGRGR
jgi:hypothetical protein